MEKRLQFIDCAKGYGFLLVVSSDPYRTYSLETDVYHN